MLEVWLNRKVLLTFRKLVLMSKRPGATKTVAASFYFLRFLTHVIFWNDRSPTIKTLKLNWRYYILVAASDSLV